MAIFKRKKQPKPEEAIKPTIDQVQNAQYLPETEGSVITRQTLLNALSTLEKYREGKSNLERRIIANEQWFKGRHWDLIDAKDGKPHDPIEPRSAWLFNCIMSKYSDYIDAYPEPNILPREINDQEEAKRLSSILPVILDQADFEKVYSLIQWYKLKAGAGIYGVFWDNSKLNGLGDVTISKIDILNLFWEPGITNIQDSENIFHVNLVDNDRLVQIYPQLEGKLKGNSLLTAKYIYDDHVDTSNQSAVVDWYYHTEHNGEKKLQYCKFVNDQVIYATENDIERETEEVETPVLNDNGEQIYKRINEDGLEEYVAESEISDNEEYEPVTKLSNESVEGTSMAEKGWYEHGMYPFIVDNMFPTEGSIVGFSYIDICKSPQEYIDKIKQGLLKNTLAGALPRYFGRIDGQINEKEFFDLDKPIVHVQGPLDSDNLVQIPVTPLNGNYMDMLNMEITEMKETTGNTDVMQGIPTGVTSGSAISALQESAGKTSRAQNKNSYMAYKDIVFMVIELIRQFYEIPRQFRITGEDGEGEFVEYDNTNIKPQYQGNDFGTDMGYRLPKFDIEVVPQKQNPHSKNGQNETAMTLYNMGVFNPEMGDQAVALIECMDFNQKEELLDKIKGNQMLLQQNESLKQQCIQLATVLDQKEGTTMADDLMQMFSLNEGQPMMPENNVTEEIDINASNEHPFNQRAREMAQESTQPQ